MPDPSVLTPGLTIPAPFHGWEKGSDAAERIARHLHDTIHRIIAGNQFPQEIESRLEALIRDVPEGGVRQLQDRDAPDAAAWAGYVEPYLGVKWLEVPWFFAETYFFRRILEATGYFGEGPGQGIDPFAPQKQHGLELSRKEIRELSRILADARRTAAWNPDTFTTLLHVDLWGNQADLNHRPAEAVGESRHADADQEREHLLADDTAALLGYLSQREAGTVRIDFMSDNAGLELVCDLALADYLLSSGLAESVTFHLKPHPVFVSDTLIANVGQTVDFLSRDEDGDVRALAVGLQAHLDGGRLLLDEDLYWCSPLSGWEMPDALRRKLASADLVVSKGDANYRRLLGDRRWAFTVPFGHVVSYFPAPLLALRTLKSEVAAGIEAARLDTAYAADPGWLVNGRWGVIQFFTSRVEIGQL